MAVTTWDALMWQLHEAGGASGLFRMRVWLWGGGWDGAAKKHSARLQRPKSNINIQWVFNMVSESLSNCLKSKLKFSYNKPLKHLKLIFGGILHGRRTSYCTHKSTWKFPSHSEKSRCLKWSLQSKCVYRAWSFSWPHCLHTCSDVRYGSGEAVKTSW